ncbi:MAG: ribonuclease III [Spirochaetes bacterium GWF1_31_7]|nr:MAG: ribonuclease III [Spirochaetes bacterium GWE1_32_154]OHD49444.1 MAG: ribonuclease III [Spirochaetes bacterium GWF1_31_7]OHD52030.1 MAG: ribonuclease III [Spirochaetes bacterium GWE2_31_10]OHD75465.1 MAG: ribonuclease III [Spirochaetes bacterium RIFOXYB1_FULL_32_8]HBD93641.1 ribonuclease III [Spirochaetia bacterium]
MDRKDKIHLKEFAKRLRIKFNSIELLEVALTHRSFSNEKVDGENNEKLEFLGDSVLGLIITDYLYTQFPLLTEGDLARIKSYIVSEEILSAIGKKLNINKYLRIGKGEELTGGREKKGLIADAFEAILGALYLDGKYTKVEEFVIRLFKDEIGLVINEEKGLDYKTLLQEYVQKKFKDCPKYRLIEETGPEHDKTFSMEVLINDKIYGNGSGKSKKEAEKTAATSAYKKLVKPETHEKG